MDGATLLSGADIALIRRYVETKYASMPAGRRAEIVADAIRRAVRRRLPDLPEPWQRELAEELIRRCLIQQRRDIRPEDVLDICLERRWDESRVREALARWTAERTSGRWTAGQAAARLNRRHPAVTGAMPVPSPAVSAAAEQRPPDRGAPQASGEPHAAGRPDETGGARGLPPAADGRAQAEPGPAEAASHRSDAAPGGAEAAIRRTEAESGGVTATAALGTATGRWQTARLQLAWGAAAFALAAGIWLGAMETEVRKDTASDVPIAPPAVAEPSPLAEAEAGMPKELRYTDFDAEPVKAYLRSRDSMLADEPYFGAIVASARAHDVHPLLLLAITGQEQGFVPKSHKQAARIANNPFNVYRSWQEYNTDIYDSADIAARTIANLGRQRPAGYDPFRWFNTKYAEDPNWANGVRLLFEKLVAVAEGRDGGQTTEASRLKPDAPDASPGPPAVR